MEFRISSNRRTRHPDERRGQPRPSDVRVGRLMALAGGLWAAALAIVLGGLGSVLVVQEWGQGNWVPIAIGIVLVLTAVAAAALVYSLLVQPARWDGERTLQGEVLTQPTRKPHRSQRRLYEGWICVAEWSSWRRPDASGPLRLIRGDGEWALLVDARGRRFFVQIPADDLPVPFWVMRHWESRGLRVPFEVLDGRPPGGPPAS